MTDAQAPLTDKQKAMIERLNAHDAIVASLTNGSFKLISLIWASDSTTVDEDDFGALSKRLLVTGVLGGVLFDKIQRTWFIYVATIHAAEKPVLL